MKVVKTLLAFAVTASLLAPIAAQEPPKQDPTKQGDIVRIDTNLVQLDVVVTDKNGKQVTDLKPEDFEISEDGKKRVITHFSYISTGTPTAETVNFETKTGEPVKPAELKRENVRRTVALVLDDLGLSFESFGYARQALKKFVNEKMQPNDMVAVLRTSAGIGVLQQFTSDKRQLLAAIERVRWNPVGRGGLSATGTLNEQSIGADIRDNIQFMQEAEESRAGVYSVGTISTINAIVRGLGEMPGRKSVVVISEAFQLFTAQGRNVDLVQALRLLTDEANANSVTIYTIDASGLQSYTLEASDRVAGYSYVIDPQVLAASGGPLIGGGAGGVHQNAPPRTLTRADTLSAQAEQDSGAAFRRLAALSSMREQKAADTHTVLSYLAQRTGGIFERNRNDLGTSIDRIMEDQQGYYLIGYRPDQANAARKDSRLHNLGVKVKRSGTKVRSRVGYFGVTDEDRRRKPRTREAQLTAALISPFASGDVGIQLTSLFGDEPNGGGSYLRSLLHVDAKDLTFKEGPDGARTAQLETVAVAFGADGQIVDQFSYPQTVNAANATEYQRMIEDGLVYILNFPIKKGGPYQMRVAVRDSNSERTGAAMRFVEVPDLTKNRLAVSGIILSNAAEVEKATAADQDIRSGPAVRQLKQGMMIDYRYIIYNAEATANAPVQTQMRLLRDGKPVFTGKLASLDASKEANPKRISTGGRLRLGPDLTPGDYVLHVVVNNSSDPKKPRTASQWIDFQITN
jgi:VWFA-related protein